MIIRSSKSVLLFPLFLVIALIKIQAQSKDTILNMVISKPYFYNVLTGANGKVYGGTSEGIVEIQGTSIRQYDRNKGYITTDKSGLPIIDVNGIGTYKERRYLHLLPYPEEAREEFHTKKDDLFYVCSGGRLYIFDLVQYGYSYPNHSFRTISKDLLGTYSGIYLKGKKLGPPIPNFTDGYIRQYRDRAFICNYELIILEKDALQTGILTKGKNYYPFQLPIKQYFNDIFETNDGSFLYIIAGSGLIRTTNSLTSDTLIYKNKNNHTQNILITENPYEIYFTDKNKLLAYAYSNGKLEEKCETKETILGGVYSDNQIYFITNDGLYRSSMEKRLEKIVDVEKSHSIIKINGSELIISTDNGLYLYNTASRNLLTLIEGVEFNRHALYKNREMIYAGSVNGLYTISEKDIQTLIEKNKTETKLNATDDSLKKIIFAISIFFIVLTSILLRYRQKLKRAEKTINILQQPQKKINREKIEQYISENLSTVSIKIIIEHFNTNGPALYEILSPDKPGSIIQQHRLNKMKQMRKEGISLDEISAATGFSKSYLKKLKG